MYKIYMNRKLFANRDCCGISSLVCLKLDRMHISSFIAWLKSKNKNKFTLELCFEIELKKICLT